MVTFGQRLRELRKAKGMTQMDLANEVGINFTYLSKLETGVVPPPREKTIIALATVLDADLDELFGLAKKIPSSLFKQVNPDKLKMLRSILDEEKMPVDEHEVLKKRIVELEASEIERLRLEEALREKERFQVLIENSVDGILIMNGELDIIYETPSAAHIIGYKPGELAGRSALGIVHEEDASMLAHEFNQVMQNPGGTGRATARVRHKNGTWRAVEAVAINLLHDAVVNGIVINFRDITDSRQYEVAQARFAVALTIEEEYNLTDTEKEVLKMMVEGQTNSQIAERLVTSYSTIKFHVSNILHKMSVANRTEAVALTLRQHLAIPSIENPPSG
jgi:PAS domain S-box-containing protein